MSLGVKVLVHRRGRNGITAAHTHVISGRPVGRRVRRRAKPSRSADCLVLRTSVQIRQLKPAMAPGFSPSDRSTKSFPAYDRVVNKSKTVWIGSRRAQLIIRAPASGRQSAADTMGQAARRRPAGSLKEAPDKWGSSPNRCLFAVDPHFSQTGGPSALASGEFCRGRADQGDLAAPERHIPLRDGCGKVVALPLFVANSFHCRRTLPTSPACLVRGSKRLEIAAFGPAPPDGT